MLFCLTLLAAPAHAATITTFPVDPAYTPAPFSGMETLVVDPVAFAQATAPDEGPVPPDAQRLRSEAKAPDTALVFTNPTNTWAWLALNGTRVGTIGPFATARFEGLRPGHWRLDLTLPNGFVRKFAITTHIPVADKPGTLAPVAATLMTDRIVLSERVYFETDSTALQAVSGPYLDAVAALLTAHPEILKVQIQGHTDDRGEASYNLALSAGRAKAVADYLAAHGVAASRLTSQGYGETRPVDTADTEEAWAKNRRVDFIVTERAAEPAAPPAAPPAKGKKKGK